MSRDFLLLLHAGKDTPATRFDFLNEHDFAYPSVLVCHLARVSEDFCAIEFYSYCIFD